MNKLKWKIRKTDSLQWVMEGQQIETEKQTKWKVFCTTNKKMNTLFHCYWLINLINDENYLEWIYGVW